MRDTFEEWSGAMADRLNEMARECGFAEIETGSQAAALIREIHGNYNSLRSTRGNLARAADELRKDRDNWKALAGEMAVLLGNWKAGYADLSATDKALTAYETLSQSPNNLNQGEGSITQTREEIK